MDIKSEQLQSRKVIGKVKNNPVMELVTKGGLNMIVMRKSDGSVEVLGASPHVALSKYLAELKCPEIEFTELSKSEGFPTLLLKQMAQDPKIQQLQTILQEEANRQANK